MADGRALAGARLGRRAWLIWLQVVLVAVLAYALVLVVAGGLATDLFALFGFGPSPEIDTPAVRAYLALPTMVLGAVLAGWAALMISLVRGPLRDGAPWALPAITRALILWFLLDTGMSIVLGVPTHALFNVPFAIALGIPLWRLRVDDAHGTVASPGGR
ncbi:MAG: hypothetical protein ACKOTZ_10335 [Chloroflexota bacterium]